MRSWALAAALAAAACGTGPCHGASGDAGPRPDAAGDAGPDAAGAFAVQYADPDHGPFTGGTALVVRGAGFADGDEVWIGGRRVAGAELQDSRHWKVVAPPGEPGARDVEVHRADGAVAAKPGGFTYEAIAVDPPSGSVAGGTYVTISGLGTDFGAATQVTFDGVAAAGVTVLGAEALTAYTPPGTAGDANVVVTTATATYRADRGYTYYLTGDPFAGGMSGGPIAGALNVVVTDAYSGDGVAGAFVAVGDPNTTPWKGAADALGQITFSGTGLVGPVSVVTTAPGYEVASFDCFDATNLTVFLRPVVPPQPTGPPGVGTEDGAIRGHVVFGDTLGLGSPLWSIVPEPRTATEKKRVYVTTTGTSIFGQPRQATTPIDYSYDPDQLAWPFEIPARPGAWAVVAVAGLYDPAEDPGGNGAQGFEPFAIGAARGVLVGPGQTRDGVDVVVDIPLDSALAVDLVDPPPVGDPGRDGPLQHVVKAIVDLGGEGTISLGAHGLPAPPGGDPPGVYTLPDGVDSVLITGAPALSHALGDASYALVAGAYTYGGSPMSARIVRGIDGTQPVEVAGFVGLPRPVDPAPDGVASSSRHAVFAPEGETLTPTFHLHYLTAEDGSPVWTAVTCAAETDVPLPDLSSIGLVWPPSGQQLYWQLWSIEVPGADYDQYTYRWNGSLHWEAYAADHAWVEFPP